ncbi:uncharacterized protein (DUF427 family) [Catalinimonas alkaloidigena]|uniref:DUF427 domain-containing protein n=1 Tax=Catalinimonas alkaloidigena TaxID=1075417 RepID=UPI00240524B5|nr:DUF427 domain-containing protein [Catalinimonas alkaloidigena]MDF9801215.1 uncharacterized protein (DUF427 family) [Catalinimonas alkaloidigena]
MKKIQPKAGQESVWDYPRPPRLEDTSKHVRVVFNGEVIADSNRARRVLETSHPPVYYIPPEDINNDFLKPDSHSSFCEFKGMAKYYSLEVNGKKVEHAGWYYPEPTERFASLKDYVAFYPSKMDACYVADEKVQPQEGDFYGGWITKDIVGPFKGGQGTWGW